MKNTSNLLHGDEKYLAESRCDWTQTLTALVALLKPTTVPGNVFLGADIGSRS